jgi:hypothetical protein
MRSLILRRLGWVLVVTYRVAGLGENGEDKVMGGRIPVTNPGLDTLMAS